MADIERWEKRAEELFYDLGDNVGRSLGSVLANQRARALQLGREMAQDAFEQANRGQEMAMKLAADARAEEIAKRAEEESLFAPGRSLDAQIVAEVVARVARSTIQQPKTREQALEEALRRIHNWGASTWCAEVAQQALGLRPS